MFSWCVFRKKIRKPLLSRAMHNLNNDIVRASPSKIALWPASTSFRYHLERLFWLVSIWESTETEKINSFLYTVKGKRQFIQDKIILNELSLCFYCTQDIIYLFCFCAFSNTLIWNVQQKINLIYSKWFFKIFHLNAAWTASNPPTLSIFAQYQAYG